MVKFPWLFRGFTTLKLSAFCQEQVEGEMRTAGEERGQGGAKFRIFPWKSPTWGGSGGRIYFGGVCTPQNGGLTPAKNFRDLLIYP